MIKSVLTICLLVCLTTLSYGQYWFGPKVGVSYIDHVYQDKDYEDDFNVAPNVNWQAGFALAYTASDLYAVYGELLYERVHKTVKDQPTDGSVVKTDMTNHFISAPVMLRVTLGKVPFHYYVNGGPRLAYWVGGKGTVYPTGNDEFWPLDPRDDGSLPPIEYKLKFNSDNASPDNTSTAYVSKPNRVQFGLTVGAGMFFDIQGGSRLQLDFRYTWQHSNMATNSDEDTNLIRDGLGGGGNYRENLEYYHNFATIGIAYLFNYDANLKRKGRSTSKESNKKKK